MTRIVNSASEEAKDFDFSTDAGDSMGRLVGDVEFIWYVYYCPKCEIEITNRNMRKSEREQKGKKEKVFDKKKKTIGLIFFVIISIVLLSIFSNYISKAETNDFEVSIETMGTVNKKIPIKYLYSANPFYVHFRKHFCPQCNCSMQIQYRSEIINSNSPEAKFYNFNTPDSRLIGDVEIRTSFFYCQNCHFDISFADMKEYESAK